MLSQESLRELQTSWLPHITAAGLDRLIELLERDSPLLIHGSFTRAVPMGCLATHVAWNHPDTAHLTVDSGICWLNHVAHLNPATSAVIREWDRCAPFDFEVRSELLTLFKEHRKRKRTEPHLGERVAELVES
jgi:hypothetical protein